MVTVGPGSFLEKRSEENPPVATSDDEECAESGARNGDGLIKEDILDEGLGEGEGDNEWGRSCFDFCLQVFADEEKGSAGDAEANAGKEEDEWEGAIEPDMLPVLVDSFYRWEGTSPQEGADEDGEERVAEEHVFWLA